MSKKTADRRKLAVRIVAIVICALMLLGVITLPVMYYLGGR